MKLLLDENVGSVYWTHELANAGHDVVRVVDVGLQGQPDSAVLRYAVREQRCILTRDKAARGAGDLVPLWRAQPAPKPSLLVIFPGKRVSIGEVMQAIANIEAADVVSNTFCPVQGWLG